MAHRKTSKRSKARTMLRLADLEQSKSAVLHLLGATLLAVGRQTFPNREGKVCSLYARFTNLRPTSSVAPCRIKFGLTVVRVR